MIKHLLKQTYQGKKVFLTGHTGFKGSWLLQWLHLLGATVKGYSLAPQNPADLYNLINGDTLCESVIEDIRHKARLEKEIIDFKPDYIFHLAAQPLVRLSYEIPAETFEVNTLGTAYVLDALKKLTKPCTVILITTDKVYENQEWLFPYREIDRLGGHDPYSASKACAEFIIASYTKSFFSPNTYHIHQKAIASARAGNVIGGGDWAKDRIIPDIVRSLRLQNTIQVRNALAVRPWQHVLEPINGYLLLGAKLTQTPQDAGSAWNFGPFPDDNKTVEELVQIAISTWGKGSFENVNDENQPHEAGLLKLDSSKASTWLKWSPVLNAKEAIKRTIDWYKTYERDAHSIQEYTIKQIQEYQQDLDILK